MGQYPVDAEKLIAICRQNDVAMLGIFGSVSRDEGTAQSDIDLLVEFKKQKGLLALVRLERAFSEAVGKKVDLVTEAAISPYIRENIMRDLQVIYDAR